MNSIISINNLSKKYPYGERLPYNSLRDEITNLFSFKKISKLKKDEFWALKDINLEIERGEVIGLIGGNGAGKSTLLKILSRITHPTSGMVKIDGRVASLLEVGTGFHPELTGRENIYLNGSILGMSRREVKQKEEEIIEFSGIKKFLEMPVKHYSSGMQTRLAFAIASHLTAEILLVDEVLAVGDAEFQKKCLGKMEDISKEGRTIILVSHNLASISDLCKRSVLLDEGQVKKVGQTDEVISYYLKQSEKNLKKSGEIDWQRSSGSKEIIIKKCWLDNKLKTGGPVTFNLAFQKRSFIADPVGVAIGIDNETGIRLCTLWSKYLNPKGMNAGRKLGVFQCKVRELVLRPGQYWLTFYIESSGTELFHIRRAMQIIVEPNGLFQSYPISGQGDLMLDQEWRIND